MFTIIKRGANNFWHKFNNNSKEVAISDFEVVLDAVANTFVIVFKNGANVPNQSVNVSEIVVIDETDASNEEVFSNVTELRTRLVELGYTAYLSATGIQSVVAGTNVTIDNTDPANPIINASTGGGGGAVDSVNGQTGVVVLDADDIAETATKKYVTPSEKTAITHTNRSILDLISEAFTTALKSTYDGVVSGYNSLIATGARLITNSEITKLSNTSGTNSGDNATNTTSNAYADAKVEDTITDGVTTKSPSQNAVFDALALKSDKSDFEDWTSFASSSTITSWVAPSVTFLQYTRSGKVLTIRGRITGTSNSVANPTLTIPFTLASLGSGQGDASLLYVNNGVSSATAGVIVGVDNTNQVQFFRDGTLALAWTGSNTKTIAFLTTFIIQ